MSFKLDLKRTVLAGLILSLIPFVSYAKLNVPSNFLVLNTGLVGWWTFDGPDLVQNATDRSGTGNSGDLIGFTSTSSAVVEGKIGQALSFNSIGGVSVPDADNMSFVSGTQDSGFSISAWVYMNDSTVFPIVTKGCGSGSCNEYSLRTGISCANNILCFRLYDYNHTGAAIGREYSASMATYQKKWTHIVGTYDGSESQTGIRIYVNGVRVDDTDSCNGSCPPVGSYISMVNTTNGTTIGQYGCCSQVNGYIDDVRVYSRALSPLEVSKLYNATAGNKIQSSQVGPNNLKSGLAGWWTFDGQDMTQNAADKSGNGNNGNLMGFTSTTTIEGKVGQALKFNGSGNNYVNLSAYASIIQFPGSLTMSAWVYDFTPSTGNGGFIFERDDSSNIEAYSLLVDNGFVGSAQPGLMFYYEAPNGNYHAVKSPNITQANKWYHVVGVYDSVANKEYLYENGQLVNSVTPTLPPNDLGGGSETIGTYACCGHGNYFNGLIDDVRIYGRALSASEAAQLYNSTAGGHANTSSVGPNNLNSGLVGWWTLDGNKTNWNTGVTQDSSGSGNNGQMINMSTTTSPVEGRVGQALTTKLGSYVNTSNGNSVKGLSAVTLSMWVYPTSYNVPNGSELYYESTGDGNGGTVTRLDFFMNPDGTVFFDGRTPDGTSDTNWLTTTGTIPLNKWTLVTATYTTSAQKIYFNGVADPTSGSIAGSSFTNSNPDLVPSIVSYPPSVGTYEFIGKIDDVRVYNRALSAAEIAQLYSIGR